MQLPALAAQAQQLSGVVPQLCSLTSLCAGLCVVNVYINYEKKFAFVEFRTGMPPPATGACSDDASPASIILPAACNWHVILWSSVCSHQGAVLCSLMPARQDQQGCEAAPVCMPSLCTAGSGLTHVRSGSGGDLQRHGLGRHHVRGRDGARAAPQ